MNNRARKNKILSIKLIAILFAMSALHVSAKTPYEFSIHAGGGYSFFTHRLPANSSYTINVREGIYEPPSFTGLFAVHGVSSSGSAGNLGIGFTGFVNPYVGLHVGLGLGLHNINVKVDSLKTFTPGLISTENNETYDQYTSLFNYSEKHRTFALSIPFMIQFQTIESGSSWRSRSNAQQGFYAKAGLKLNILLSNTYETEVTDGYNLAYFPSHDNTAGTQEFAGLGKFKGDKAKGNVGFVQAVFASEAGMKWRIANDMFVYTGVYFDYGLNDPVKDNRQPTSNYTSRESFQDFALLDFAERAHLMTIGFKISLAFIR